MSDFPPSNHLQPPDPTMWDSRWLLELDWKRFSETVMALVHLAGYRVGDPDVRMDASTRFLLHRSLRHKHLTSLVHCAAWEHPWVSPEDVKEFAGAVKRGVTGVFITPGAFSPAARDLAEEIGIEKIAGVDLIRMVCQLTPAEQNYLLQLTTAGDYRRPSCPCCQRKLILGRFPDPPPNPREKRKKPMIIKRSSTINQDVDCGELLIKRGCNVVFLRPVKAEKMEILGGVSGNFVVSGPVRIAAGANLSGLVSAKSIEVNEDASLDGVANILREVELVLPAPDRQVWYCESQRLGRGCATVRLRPRQMILTEQGLLEF